MDGRSIGPRRRARARTSARFGGGLPRPRRRLEAHARGERDACGGGRQGRRGRGRAVGEVPRAAPPRAARRPAAAPLRPASPSHARPRRGRAPPGPPWRHTPAGAARAARRARGGRAGGPRGVGAGNPPTLRGGAARRSARGGPRTCRRAGAPPPRWRAPRRRRRAWRCRRGLAAGRAGPGAGVGWRPRSLPPPDTRAGPCAHLPPARRIPRCGRPESVPSHRIS
jgi:hypothetical protein